MPENACCDPLEKPCAGAPLILVEEGDLPPLCVGALVSWPQHRPLPELPDGVDLEIRSLGSAHFVNPGRVWSLYLDCLDPFDLGAVEEVLEAAALSGCNWVVAAPLRKPQEFRYRLYALLRLLCDRFKLKFSIYEDQPREAAELLNHYLANQRGCCRFRSLTGQRV